MKLLGTITIGLICCCTNLFAQNNSSYLIREANGILAMTQEFHYRPLAADDRLSESWLSEIFQQLDPRGTFLGPDARESLRFYEDKLDNMLSSNDPAFLMALNQAFQAGMQQAQDHLAQLEEKELSYGPEDTIRLFSRRSSGGSLRTTPLAKVWEKRLKYYVLEELNQDESLTQQDGDFVAAEKEAREKVIERFKCQISKIAQHPNGIDTYIGDRVLQALALCFDPHSAYFSPSQKKAFENSLATNTFSFGLEIAENEDGKILISRLTPGGPAWKSGRLNKGDEITSLRLGQEEALDMACMDVYELNGLLNSTSASMIRLVVRKSNATQQEVSLKKEKLDVEENSITGFVLEGEKKIGYIYLPGFYTDWEDENALGCSNDVAKELFKLQMEGIQGLILDLRYNGGGSMYEALGLSGIFIDEGPVSLEENNAGKVSLLKDLNRGTIYDGPLSIMINGASASASEIFSAALQDYHRALIIGSPSFGKSTGQVILPIREHAQTGFMKLTGRKFYRINGESHQLKGVKPDIYLPDLMEAFVNYEKGYQNPISSGATDKEVSFKAYPSLPIDQLQAGSRDRLDQSAYFQAVINLRDAFKKDFDTDKVIPLQLSSFRQAWQPTYDNYALIDELPDTSSKIFSVKNHRLAQGLLNIDPYKKEMNAQLIEKIHDDPYIEEAYFLMKDLIDIGQ